MICGSLCNPRYTCILWAVLDMERYTFDFHVYEGVGLDIDRRST